MDGKLHVCSSGEGGTDGKDLPVCSCCTHDCGCTVDGGDAMVAY